MTITIRKAEPRPVHDPSAHPTSALSVFRMCVADATATAATDAQRRNPLGASGLLAYDNAYVIDVTGATRVRFRQRCNDSTTGVSQAFEGVIIGLAVPDPDKLESTITQWPTGTEVFRADNVDPEAAARITFTFPGTFTNALQASNGDYLSSLTSAVDVLGASHIILVPTQAATLTGTGAASTIEVMALN